jgi:hypothetical protein
MSKAKVQPYLQSSLPCGAGSQMEAAQCTRQQQSQQQTAANKALSGGSGGDGRTTVPSFSGPASASGSPTNANSASVQGNKSASQSAANSQFDCHAFQPPNPKACPVKGDTKAAQTGGTGYQNYTADWLDPTTWSKYAAIQDRMSLLNPGETGGGSKKTRSRRRKVRKQKSAAKKTHKRKNGKRHMRSKKKTAHKKRTAHKRKTRRHRMKRGGYCRLCTGAADVRPSYLNWYEAFPNLFNTPKTGGSKVGRNGPWGCSS